VREGFVVVISILIAFSLDAWWVRQGELRQESEIRSSLQAEFVTNRERLSGDMDYVRSYTEASARVLAATESGIEGDEEATSLSVDLWNTLSWRTANLSTATLDAVVSAGRLELIRDDALRSALAGWRAQLEDMAEEEEFEWREVVERYRPHLGRLIVIPSLEGPTPRGLDGEELERVLGDHEFRSYLSMRVDVSLVSLDAKEEALEELDRIVELLRGAS
jgi:hypothetical protein